MDSHTSGKVTIPILFDIMCLEIMALLLKGFKQIKRKLEFFYLMCRLLTKDVTQRYFNIQTSKRLILLFQRYFIFKFLLGCLTEWGFLYLKILSLKFAQKGFFEVLFLKVYDIAYYSKKCLELCFGEEHLFLTVLEL